MFKLSTSALENPCKAINIPPQMPDPNNYVVIKVADQLGRLGKWCAMFVKYRGCTNYEGNKILVFKDHYYDELKAQGLLDPHFSDSKEYIHPFARFEPTDAGWEAAKLFIKIMST